MVARTGAGRDPPGRRRRATGDFHSYAVVWGDGEATFLVDDEVVHRSPQAPVYPLQIMVAMFDFPAWSTGDDGHLVPELVIDWIAGDDNAS